VTLRTVYVRGIARSARAHTLRGLLAHAGEVNRRAVVDVDRFGDLTAITLLDYSAAAFAPPSRASPLPPCSPWRQILTRGHLRPSAARGAVSSLRKPPRSPRRASSSGAVPPC